VSAGENQEGEGEKKEKFENPNPTGWKIFLENQHF
jgi:hypothetical protein